MSTERARRGLLIGIADYPKLPKLEGCVADARVMHSVLRDTFGFPEDQLTVLVEAQATQAAIRAAFTQLVADTQRDDVVVIYYAGHGGQMTDREFDEPGGLDSTLQPWDTEGWQGENRDITDDEIGLFLEELSAKTQYITMIVDACHSGTITRDGTGPRARTTPPDRRPVEQLPPSPIPPERRRPATTSGPSGWLPVTDRYVLISGCRDDELSYECYPAEGGTHGTLTYFLAQALTKATPQTTYRDVFERVASQVNAVNARQHPQMEGRADREIFGVQEFVPARHVLVTKRDGATVTLGGGVVHGVAVGSRFAVHAPGTKQPDEASRLGEIEIVEAGVTYAEGRLLEEAQPDTIGVDARAFETQRAFGTFRLRTIVHDTPGPEAVAMRELLATSTQVDLVPAGTRDAVSLHLLPARTTVTADDLVARAGPLATAQWALLSEAGDLMAPLHPPTEATVIRENLETIARYRAALAFENPNPDSRFRGKISLELLTKNAAGEWVEAMPPADGGLVTYTEGDWIGFRVRNALDEEVYFAIVDFEPNGAVTPLWPSAQATHRQEKLSAAPQKFELGPGHRRSNVSWPVNFPYVDSPDRARDAEAIETIKLFVTEHPANFSVLKQGPVRGKTSPLSALLTNVFSGSPSRGIELEPERTDEWTTVQRSFIVRRRTTATLSATEPSVALHDVQLSAPGLTGTAEAFVGSRGRREADAQLAAPVHDALAASGMDVRRTIAIADAREAPPAPGARGGGTPAPMELAIPEPPTGHGQLVMAVDELGTISWHLPVVSGARGNAAAQGTVRRRYQIPRDTIEPLPPPPGARGLIATAGKALLKELVFPLIDPLIGEIGASFVNRLEAQKTPYRVRRFEPGTHTGEVPGTLDGAGWSQLGEGRALLFLHGTFSRSHSAFGDLPAPLLGALHAHYGGRVFAFDHYTLSHDPRENLRQFLSLMPDGLSLDVDIVAHSRGGLVARMFTEQFDSVSRGLRQVRVGQAIFVGSPNAGTGLADVEQVGKLLDLITNLANVVPSAGVGDVLALVLGVLKQVAVSAAKGLDGLMAMDPDGEFATALREGAPREGTHYRAIAANVTPADPGLRRFVLRHGLGRLLTGMNDLVVPTESCFGAEAGRGFPITDRLVLEGNEAVSHTKYFADAGVQQQLRGWLTAT